MAWPTDDLDTSSLDQGTDTPPRAEILKHSQKLSALIAGRATASGVCDLDATTKVPLARIPQGAGSGLDADKLDGNQASDFSLITHNHTNGVTTILYDPHVLVGPSMAINAWTTVNSTTLGNALAVAAILRVYIPSSSDSQDNFISIRRNGSVLSSTDRRAMAVFMADNNGATATHTTNMNEFTVKLDAGSDFQYYCQKSSTFGDEGYIYLVGYIV